MEHVLWVEKFRPQKVSECILPSRIKDQFLNIIKQGDIPNLLLTGGAGVGKTTVAKALCQELQLDWIIINASAENGIDTVRNQIKSFASRTSIMGGKKVIILDEADSLTNQAQTALRNFIETYSKHCTFIFTCNFPNRIIDPIHSRCSKIVFDVKQSERAEMMGLFYIRVTNILKQEKIKFCMQSVGSLINKFYPDNRKILNELQQYSKGGCIDEGVLGSSSDDRVEDYIECLKKMNFKDARQWLVDNQDIDTTTLFRRLYDTMYTSLSGNSIPEVILVLSDYQQKDYYAYDKFLNLSAMTVELLGCAKFK